MRIFILFFILITELVPNLLIAQRTGIYAKLDSSSDYGQAAKEYANATLDTINICFEQSTEHDIQACLTRAGNKMDEAVKQTANAILNALQARDATEATTCRDAENKSGNARESLYQANIRFDKAAKYLSAAGGTYDDEELEDNLFMARSNVEDAIKFINAALTEINDAVTSLSNCK